MQNSRPNVDVKCGEVIEVLKNYADNTFDALLSDPPYGLVPHKGAKAGFMGLAWDYDVPSVALWQEVYRVLKPGAPLLAFGGTRTYHRMVCAIEDAGFEVRDQLAWVYGCLSEDTEILTERGWKLGVNVEEGERVAAWDSSTEAITLSKIEQITIEPYRGQLVHLINNDTDQLLTPNHRVYLQSSDRVQINGVRRAAWSNWQVLSASESTLSRRIRLPMGGFHEGPGIGGVEYAALLGWIWTEGGYDPTGTGIRIYQSPSANPEKTAEIDGLVRQIIVGHKRYDRERIYRYKTTERKYTEACWFFSGDTARRVRDDLPAKHPSWSLLWRMTLAEKRSFWDAAMKGDGSGGTFYQKDPKDLEWAQVLLSMMGQRGKISMRKAPRDGGAVCVTPRSTTELQSRHLRGSDETYNGLVWCVRVSTGAFVARRCGKIFITGNSGFPKSQDVSKAADKGHKRPRLREKTTPDGKPYSARHPNSSGKPDDINAHNTMSGQTQHDNYITEPVTNLAKTWHGYGTALKPALEPIVLARKPLEGTVVQNLAKWGCGALAIDACRIGEETITINRFKDGMKPFGSGAGHDYEASTVQGRWPANLILDEEAGAMLDAQSGNRKGMSGGGKHKADYPGGMFGGIDSSNTARGDSGGASRFFYSAKVNRKERGEGNNHPTLKPIALTQYLARLIKPPIGGHILVPFSGAGSEIIGCINAGWADITGIEMDPDYVAIAKKRIDERR